MSDKIELEQLEADIDPDAPTRAGGDLRRLSDVPVEVTVEMGRTRMTVGETLELRHGSIVTLNRMAGEPVDLLVNGTPIARGEVVVIDEQFGLRITDVLGSRPRTARAPPPPRARRRGRSGVERSAGPPDRAGGLGCVVCRCGLRPTPSSARTSVHLPVRRQGLSLT